MNQIKLKMKQLDVDMSPPANITKFCLALANLTFDLNPSDLSSVLSPEITFFTLVTLTFDLY